MQKDVNKLKKVNDILNSVISDINDKLKLINDNTSDEYTGLMDSRKQLSEAIVKIAICKSYLTDYGEN